MIKVIKGINSLMAIDESIKNQFMAIHFKFYFNDLLQLFREVVFWSCRYSVAHVQLELYLHC